MVLPAASKVVGRYAGIRIQAPLYNAILGMRNQGIGATQAINQLRSEGFRFRDRIVNQIYNEKRRIELVSRRAPFIRDDFHFTPNTTVTTNQFIRRQYRYTGSVTFRNAETGEIDTLDLSFTDDADRTVGDVKSIFDQMVAEMESNEKYPEIPEGSEIFSIGVTARLRGIQDV